MNANNKIKVLVAACIIIVSTLSLIQYYLVKNTYQLTKDKYYAEVKTELNKIISAPVAVAIEAKVLDNLKQAASLYVTGGLSKQGFFEITANKNDSVIKAANNYFNAQIKSNSKLKGIRYQSRYDEILLEVNGSEFTLLAESEKPYVYVGQLLNTPNTLLLSRGNTQSVENKNIERSKDKSYETSFVLRLKGSQFIDVSGWKQEVVRRMTGIFFLAAGLIIAVIVLFYLVFSAMLRQKRIADIKTDFANNITHELKTPLSSVNVILKSLERKEVQTNPVLFNDMLQSLNRQHSKIQLTVDSVLESAMLTDLEIKLEELDITDFLIQYTSDHRLASHTLVVKIESGHQILKINATILEKALNNLLENATKYSPEGSEISFKTYMSKGYYLIELADQGLGIAPYYQSRVFDKFYRIPEQNMHAVKGLGLGLYITKQAIKQLGGSLMLVSKPEEGSTFIIKLPVNES